MAKLAVNGGSRARTEMIQPWPVAGEKEAKAMEKVLNGVSWGTLGPEVRRFEKRFAGYQQAKHGLCVANGTVTLEIALRALGIGYGDEVIVPPYTFYSTASSVIMVAATPVFADIEPDSYNIDPDRMEEAITPRTKAVIPVHVGGRACNMERIMDIARKHGLYVIEDCAHAHGSERSGRRVGSIGDAGSFSFQNSKNLTCGEGGFLTTNNTELYKMMWSVHTCGRSFDDTGWYSHANAATNARMTEFQAVVLDAQMDLLDEQIRNREENAALLNSMLEHIPCVEPMPADPKANRNSYHLFIFKYFKERCKGLPREMFIKALQQEGVPTCSGGYNCLYGNPVFSGENFRKLTGSKIDYKNLYLENSEKACREEGVWLTQNTMLGGKKGIEQTAEAIMKIYENADELL
jgi:dTDP-4-amino-4,6-dideoxygalactose transaminase